MEGSLNGIIVPLVTPLLDNDKLDVEGLERLVEHVVDGGVSGVFVLGTTGESQSISFSLRDEMICRTSKFLGGRLPLLVGISDTSMSESVRLSSVAEAHGAYAVVSAPPYYFASGQPELIDFYETLIPKLGLPVFLYNMPTHTKVSFAPDSLKRIADNPKVIGFKDSSANGAYFNQVMYEMRDRQDFYLFVGPEEMTAEMVMMGANGGVNGGANIFPRLYVEMYKAASVGDIASVRAFQKIIMQVSSTIYNQGKFGSSYLMGLKCALSLLDICSGELAKPFSKFGEQETAQIKKALDDLRAYPLLKQPDKVRNNRSLVESLSF